MSQWLRSFFCAESGSVLIITGLMIVSLLAVSGAAVDLGRQQLLRAKLQQATDAGAVAAAVLDSSATDAQRTQAAERYFALNFPDGYMGIPRPAPSVSVAGDIVVDASVNLNTKFIKLMGINTVQSIGHTKMDSETITSGGGTYDIILTMDVSGSMSIHDPPAGARFMELRKAAKAIADNLLTNNTTNSRIAANTWDNTLRSSIDFQTTFPPMDGYLNANVSANGGTCALLGLQKAQQQAAGFRPDAIRAVVYLTDGVDGCSEAAELNVCNDLKNNGVVVYTIALGNDVSAGPWAPTARHLLSNCASGTPATNEGQYFFIAPDGNQLQAVFQSILTSVKTMRITE